MVRCELFDADKRSEWDQFVDSSKTPLFFFKRNFLEYHEKALLDSSILFFHDEILVALLPASRQNSTLTSHGGVTYGGLIVSPKTRTEVISEIFMALKAWALEQGIDRIIYKAIPFIFHTQSAQEDLYFLHNTLNATLYRRDLSSVIYLKDRMKLSKGRKWLVARAKKSNLEVVESQDWPAFHRLISRILQKHDAIPVHSIAELEKLSKFFPAEVILKAVFHENNMVAAALLFRFKNVVHTQYLATDEEGKDLGALDYIIETSIQEAQAAGFQYFNFGVSTEQGGRVLNQGLVAQKESFGSRGMAIDFYEISIQ